MADEPKPTIFDLWVRNTKHHAEEEGKKEGHLKDGKKEGE
jgi:hypothetical protein